MALLSRSVQLEVDNSKDGIEDLQERINNLQGFMNGYALWILDVNRFAGQISRVEAELTAAIEKHFGSGSDEAEQLIERTRIGTAPAGLDKDGLKRQLERNVAKAQDALQDGINMLEARIAALKAGTSATQKPLVQENNNVPPAEKEPIFILKPSLWGMGVDLRELWRRLRGR